MITLCAFDLNFFNSGIDYFYEAVDCVSEKNMYVNLSSILKLGLFVALVLV